MSTTIRATATIARVDERTDVAVPPGTTVAGLLAMLEVDTSDPEIAVSLADGSRADLAAVIGGDLPSGAILAVTAETESRRERLRAVAARETNWFEITAAAATVLLGILSAAVILASAWWPSIPLPLRIGAAVVALGCAALLFARRSFAVSPAGALFLPLLAGSVLAMPVGMFPGLLPSTLPIAMVGSALVAFGAWLAAPRAAIAAAAAFWGAVALCGGIGSLLGAAAGNLAPLFLAGGVALVLVAPGYALQIPDSQLVDLPLLTTSAPALRSPEVPPPSRVTRRRVARTIEWGQAVTDTLTLAGVSLAVAATPVVVLNLGWQDLPQQASLACLLASILALALLPRDRNSHLLRASPRIGAVIQVGLLATALAQQGLPSQALVAALLVAAAALAAASVPVTEEPTSAMVARLGDLLQGLMLLVLVPSAFLAAGAFDLVREIAS